MLKDPCWKSISFSRSSPKIHSQNHKIKENPEISNTQKPKNSNKTQFISNNQQQNQPTWPTRLIESNKHTNPEKPSQFGSQQQQAQPIHNRSKLKSAIIDPTTPTDSTLWDKEREVLLSLMLGLSESETTDNEKEDEQQAPVIWIWFFFFLFFWFHFLGLGIWLLGLIFWVWVFVLGFIFSVSRSGFDFFCIWSGFDFRVWFSGFGYLFWPSLFSISSSAICRFDSSRSLALFRFQLPC